MVNRSRKLPFDASITVSLIAMNSPFKNSLSSSTPLRAAKTVIASSSLPFRISHRGDSGMLITKSRMGMQKKI